MAGLILSKSSGFLRDIFVGIKFSEPVFRDSFTLAFTIPDLVYNLLIGGSIQAAITPSLSASVAAGKEEKGVRAVSIFISFFAILLVIVCALGMTFADQLYSLYRSGEHNAITIHLAASASRWLFPQIVFMMLAALCIGILNAYKRFGSTSFGPTIYNVCVLAAILVFAGNSREQLMRTTFGIMLAAAVYFLYQAVIGRDLLKKFHFIWAPGDRDFHALVKRALPILVSASVVQLNMLILNYFAMKLPDAGNVYALRNASTTWQLPYGIFAVAIGNVMLPSLAEHYGKKDYEGASKLLSSRLKSALFLTVPSAGIMFVMNSEVIRGIFQWSASYTNDDCTRAGAFLAGYSIAIITHTVVFIMNQAFYAIGRTRVPLMAGCIGLIINPVGCTLLMPYMGGFALTLSYSITSILQMTVLCAVYCRNRELRPKGMLSFVIKVFMCLGILIVALNVQYKIPVNPQGKIMELTALGVRVLLSFVLYVISSMILRVPESLAFLEKIKSVLKRSH